MTHDAAATKVQLFERSPIRPRDRVIEYREILLRLLTAASGPVFLVTVISPLRQLLEELQSLVDDSREGGS